MTVAPLVRVITSSYGVYGSFTLATLAPLSPEAELLPGPQDVAHAVIISASTPQSSRLCMLFSSFI